MLITHAQGGVWSSLFLLLNNAHHSSLTAMAGVRHRDKDLDSKFDYAPEKRRKTWRDDPIAMQKPPHVMHVPSNSRPVRQPYRASIEGATADTEGNVTKKNGARGGFIYYLWTPILDTRLSSRPTTIRVSSRSTSLQT